MNDDQFRRILDSFGLSWPGYRKVRKGVIKRLIRHMQQTAVRNAGAYIEQVETLPAVRQEVRQLLTVSISHFFRDRLVWKALRDDLIPAILSGNPGRVNVWSAGCALGQEAYSFAMLWRTLADTAGQLPPLLLLATDMNRDYLAMAASGRYARTIAREVPQEYLDRFFQPEGDHLTVREELRDCITWRHHDLADASPPHGPFHIAFMRNSLLTYCRKEMYQDPVRRIIDRLAAGGFLIVGARERLSCGDFGLIALPSCPGVYRKA
jgi:chemotaxis protein methyltransferase CheR